METNSRQFKQRDLERQRATRRKRKYIIFVVEIVLLAAMVGVLFLVFSRGGEGPKIDPLPSEPESLAIPSEVQEDIESPVSTMKGYWNIALFGIDANSEAELVKGGHSDTIIIASINLDTGNIKLVSVYRDTYLNTNPGADGDNYRKANHAYHVGGGEQAIKMLNSNLGLNITDYISIGYEGLIDVVDGLGGVYLDVDDTELLHINNYQYSIVKTLGGDPEDPNSYTKVTKTGYQKLNGLQAAAYCRIRYRTGNDFARAASQREVLMAIEDQVKQADINTLTKVFEDAMKHVVTSLTSDDILPYLTEVANYKIVGEDGFPQLDALSTAGMGGAKGDCVIPLSLESNVVWLHEFLFGDENYTVPSTVQEYTKQIETDTKDRLKN